MPTQNFSSLNGYNSLISGVPNKTTSVFRGGGTTQNSGLYTQTTVSSPSVFDGSSNDGISTAIIAGAGPVGLSLMHPITASGLGAPNHLRKRAEVNIGDLMIAHQDGLNQKQNDRTPNIQVSGIRMLRDGRFVSPTGAVITADTFGTDTHTNVMTAASGHASYGDNSATPGRLRGQTYLFKNGVVNTKINLGIRSQ